MSRQFLHQKKMTPYVEVFFHGNYRGGSYFKTSLGSVIFLLEIFTGSGLRCHLQVVNHPISLSRKGRTYISHSVQNCKPHVIRDLKQLRRRRKQQHKKKIGFMRKTTDAFQYISSTSTARLRSETSQCDVIWRTWTYDDKFSFLYFKMDKDLKNSTLGKVAYI